MTTPNRRIGNNDSPIIDVPTRASTSNRPAFVLKKKYWIPGLLFLLLILVMVTSHFLGKTKTVASTPTQPTPQTSEIVQMRKQMEEMQKQLEEAKKSAQAPLAPIAPPVAEAPRNAMERPVESIPAAERVGTNYQRHVGSVAIKRVGYPIHENGETWYPLFLDREPSSTRTWAEPVGADLKTRIGMASWDLGLDSNGKPIKRPVGRFEVFKTIRTDENKEVNLIALRATK